MVPNAPAASSHHKHMHGADNGPQDLHAGGATFPAYAYNLGNQPVGSYNQPQSPPGQGSLFYCRAHARDDLLLSDGQRLRAHGVRRRTTGRTTAPCAPLGATPTGFGGRQDPLDFVGSDVAMTSTECCASGTTYNTGRLTGSVTWGEPFEFPTIGGPIVYGYRPQRLQGQRRKDQALDMDVLRDHERDASATGTIRPSRRTTARRSPAASPSRSRFTSAPTSSGTTFLFTDDLNAQCNVTFKKPYNKAPYQGPSRSAAWPFGVNQTWPGPGSASLPNPALHRRERQPGRARRHSVHAVRHWLSRRRVGHFRQSARRPGAAAERHEGQESHLRRSHQ